MKGLDFVYSVGLWTARAGKEETFKKSWEDFATWSKNNIPGAITALLLQDREDPRKFLTVGPWKDEPSVQTWRASPEFKAFVSQVKGLCDEFRPMTFKAVVSI
jgi:quinol monooxygenase YgiN